MKKMKTGLKVFLIILGVLVAVIGSGVLFILIGLDMKDAPIADVDITKVADGSYRGELNGSRFGNTVEVTVSGGKVTDIVLLRDMVISKDGMADQVFKAVEDQQSLQVVDAVSGGTVTVKAYLKSIENALTEAGK